MATKNSPQNNVPKVSKLPLPATDSPLVIDLENSTSWYAGQFDFYKATIDESNKSTKNATMLTTTIVNEILAGEYKTLKHLLLTRLLTYSIT